MSRTILLPESLLNYDVVLTEFFPFSPQDSNPVILKDAIICPTLKDFGKTVQLQSEKAQVVTGLPKFPGE